MGRSNAGFLCSMCGLSRPPLCLPINSWLDHTHHHEQAVPLGLQLALLVGMTNEHHVTWVDVLSQDLLVPLGLCFFVIFVEV
jgi:hypothetical protein